MRAGRALDAGPRVGLGGRLRMDVTVAVDCMGGDHGAQVTVPAALACLRRDPEAACVLVGQREAIERRARAEPHRPRGAAHHPARDRSGRDGRGPRDGAARQEGLVDARGGGPRQGRHRGSLRERGQHRRADGDIALRAEDAARHRPARDRGDPAHGERPHLRARSRRQRRFRARAPAAVRHHVRGAGELARRDSRAPRSDCSTSGRRTSRATIRSSSPRS